MFVRVKQQGGRVYHYLVAAERSGGRVRQKTVAYLGDYPSVEAALEGLPAEIAKLKEEAHECAARADRVRLYLGAGVLEKNGGEVPRSTRVRGQGMSQHGRKVCSEYWNRRERAERCDELIREKTALLKKLRAACSAHESELKRTFVGTTVNSPDTVLQVRWEARPAARLCWLERVRPSGRRGVVCLLSKLDEEAYNDPEYRWHGEVRFWKAVTEKLNGLRLASAERGGVEAQIAATIRQTSQDEVSKYDEEAAAFWGALRKGREAREAREHARWEAGQAQSARWKAERSAHEVPGAGKI